VSVSQRSIDIFGYSYLAREMSQFRQVAVSDLFAVYMTAIHDTIRFRDNDIVQAFLIRHLRATETCFAQTFHTNARCQMRFTAECKLLLISSTKKEIANRKSQTGGLVIAIKKNFLQSRVNIRSLIRISHTNDDIGLANRHRIAYTLCRERVM